MDLFDSEDVARGYAGSRPRFHSHVIDLVRSALGLEGRLARALDVGCGAGMSTSALLELARCAIGVDAAAEMIAAARPKAGLAHLVATAENLPFSSGAFEAITASGAINWIDRGRFLPEARRVLRRGGWLIVYDGAEQGAMAGEPSFAAWYRDEYRARLPRPPRDESAIADDEAARSGFRVTHRQDYALEWPFQLPAYVDFMMTQTNVTAAVAEGRESHEGIRTWLSESLEPVFAGAERHMLFGGYAWVLESAS